MSKLSLSQFSGRIKWLLSWRPEISYLCGGKFDPQQGSKKSTEFVLKIDATVTRAINGQKVSAFSHTFVTSQALNMGFSIASPATFYTDMPFETWVRILFKRFQIRNVKIRFLKILKVYRSVCTHQNSS